jgi:hypothetical protein
LKFDSSPSISFKETDSPKTRKINPEKAFKEGDFPGKLDPHTNPLIKTILYKNVRIFTMMVLTEGKV